MFTFLRGFTSEDIYLTRWVFPTSTCISGLSSRRRHIFSNVNPVYRSSCMRLTSRKYSVVSPCVGLSDLHERPCVTQWVRFILYCRVVGLWGLVYTGPFVPQSRWRLSCVALVCLAGQETAAGCPVSVPDGYTDCNTAVTGAGALPRWPTVKLILVTGDLFVLPVQYIPLPVVSTGLKAAVWWFTLTVKFMVTQMCPPTYAFPFEQDRGLTLTSQPNPLACPVIFRHFRQHWEHQRP